MLGRYSSYEYHLVAASSGIVAFGTDVANGLVSLAVGLIGVFLARWVFVNRQYRETSHTQKMNETLPLTLVAMLVTGVVIWDRQFSVSTSAFVGLGVGWTAVLLLDVLGEWVLSKAKVMFTAGPADPAKFPKEADLSGKDGKVTSAEVDIPDDMMKTLRQLDHIPPTNSSHSSMPPAKKGK